MEEAEILFYHEPGARRVKELEYPCQQEYDSDDEGAQPPDPIMESLGFHSSVIRSSITAFTFAKISSGGSILPSPSEQSIRMNFGSREACLA